MWEGMSTAEDTVLGVRGVRKRWVCARLGDLRGWLRRSRPGTSVRRWTPIGTAASIAYGVCPVRLNHR